MNKRPSTQEPLEIDNSSGSQHSETANNDRSNIRSSSGAHYYSNDYQEDTIKISELLGVIKSKKAFILGIMFTTMLLASFYTLLMPPKYESSAMVQIENKAEGMNQMLQSLDPSLSSAMGISTGALRSQIEAALIGSRFILEPTIEALGLNIKIQPHYFPLIGNFIANHRKSSSAKSDDLAKPWLGLSQYAWGGEKLVVKQLEVPAGYLDKSFKVVIGKNGHYDLYTPDDQLLLEGVVGKPAISETSSQVPNVRCLITQIRANTGVAFKVVPSSLGETIKAMTKNLTIADLGLSQQTSLRETTHIGVLNIVLRGTNAEKLPEILNTIIYYAIKKNTNKKTAEAEKTLRFLDLQVITLKNELDQAETALANYKTQQGVLGVSTASTFLLEQMVNTEKSLAELKMKKTALLQEFTNKHPYVIAIKDQQRKLEKELATIEGKVKVLPQSEQKMLSLKRDVEVKNQLYVLLLNKIQQLQIVKEGTISDVRILGLATPAEELPSKRLLIILNGLFFGLILSLGIVFIQRALAYGVGDPDRVEEQLGIPVYAIVPYSKRQAQLTRAMARKFPGSGPFVLAAISSKDLAIEGLRSLRTMLQFAMQGAKNNVIAILGSSQNIGKSFASLNLAYVFADSGKRVLLIDADLRKGKVSSYLMQPKYPGLAEVLSGEVTLKQAKRTVRENALDFISTGEYPHNPAELLFNGNLNKFMSSIQPHYDVIIIDTPPILAVADSILIAKYASINLLMLGSHVETLRSVKHAVKSFEKGNIKINGLIFNNTKLVAHDYYCYNYYSGYYSNKYGYYSDDK